jgi:hypothetical protein
VNRLVPILFRIALSSLHVALVHSADALDDVPGIAAVSASDQGAMPNTAAHGVATGAPRRTLDLRPPDLQSLHNQNLQPVVISADPEEAEAVAIAAAPLLPGERPDTQPALAGIASLYWAVRHPTGAWRVLLPIQLNGYDTDIENRGRAAERATPETLTEQREISANPAPAMLAHHTGGNSVRRRQLGEAT